MTEQQMESAAKRLYAILDKLIPQMGEVVINYGKEYVIEADIKAKPFDVHLKVEIHKQNGLITILSKLPYDVGEEMVDKFATYITEFNHEKISLGSFDYSPSSRKIVFRTSVVYKESLISEATLKEVLDYVVDIVCKYNKDIFKHTSGK